MDGVCEVGGLEDRRRWSARVRAGSAAVLLWGFGCAVAAILYLGWWHRDEGLITAESGLGYALGVAGAAAMVLLLLYSARKRIGILRRWGRLRPWLDIHAALGMAGPALVLLHCNFRLGSVNSSVALGSMLLVAASGFVGRYLYTRIHRGLDGRRAILDELRRDLSDRRSRAPALLGVDSSHHALLSTFATEAMARPAGLSSAVRRAVRLTIRTRLIYPRLAYRLGHESERCLASRSSWASRRRLLRANRRFVRAYLAKAREVATFACYERLFSLWHIIHVPLFLMLVGATVVHVVAVHMY